MIGAGDRDRKIVIERDGGAGLDDYGQPVADSWAAHATAWARVRFGTAQEKREAAQEAGSQAATFECISTAAMRSVVLTDRIQFDGSAWDITEIAPLDRMTIRFTATRAR